MKWYLRIITVAILQQIQLSMMLPSFLNYLIYHIEFHANVFLPCLDIGNINKNCPVQKLISKIFFIVSPSLTSTNVNFKLNLRQVLKTNIREMNNKTFNQINTNNWYYSKVLWWFKFSKREFLRWIIISGSIFFT